jgi:hypothetical protein
MALPEEQLRPLRVDLSEVEIIATMNPDEVMDYRMAGYVDLETGEVHQVFLEALSYAQGDIELDDVSAEAEEQIELAKLISSSLEERFVRIQPWESRYEFERMREFALASQNPLLREELLHALSQHKPFRRFKDRLFDFPEVRDAWHAYQEHSRRQDVKAWLRGCGVEAIDASPRTQPLPSKW